MATAPKTDAQKVTEYRKQAADTSLPQPVRDQADKKANEIEKNSVEKATGVKLAKGGMAGKAAMKKPMPRGAGSASPMAVDKIPAAKKGAMPFAKGGAVAKKAPAKKMAVGGMAKKGCK